jgi:hypothetical protein
VSIGGNPLKSRVSFLAPAENPGVRIDAYDQGEREGG